MSLLLNEDFINQVKTMDYSQIAGVYFEIDMSPFDLKEFRDDYKGFKSAYKEIQNLVELTPEDHAGWESFLKNMLD